MYVALVARFALVKTLSSLVTVWVTESLLVQVTVVPAVTVSVAGEKELLDIVTELPVDVVDVVVEVVPYPEHAARIVKPNSKSGNSR